MASNIRATTFTLFPHLPLELRLKIWSHITPGPRTIAIRYQMNYSRHNGNTVPTFSGWTSRDPNPITLQICCESRSEALKSYQLAFGSHFNSSKIYFDFSKDILRFGNGPGEGVLTDSKWFASGPSDYLLDVFLGGDYHGADDAEKIRFMVIDFNEDIYARRSFCWDEIRLFGKLEELTIMPWDEDEMAEELMDVYKTTLGNVARAHTEWVVPEISVLSAISGKVWGTLRASVVT